MSDETLRAFLSRRKRELIHRIAALRGQIEPLERELAQIRRTQSSLPSVMTLSGVTIETVVGLPPINSKATVDQPHAGGSSGTQTENTLPQQLAERFAEMTIKECTIQSLLDAFPHGATSTQIREYILNVSGREILQSSLRPQLHRLKADGILIQDTSTDTWDLSADRRKIMPVSRVPMFENAMEELKDEEPDSEV